VKHTQQEEILCNVKFIDFNVNMFNVDVLKSFHKALREKKINSWF